MGVTTEREACARLAESLGRADVARAIRERGDFVRVSPECPSDVVVLLKPTPPLGFDLPVAQDGELTETDNWAVKVAGLINGEAERALAAKPIPAFKPTPFDFAMAEAVRRLERDNPPPPDALLPDGCSRWWPRVDVVDREEGLCARLTWEARK